MLWLTRKDLAKYYILGFRKLISNILLHKSKFCLSSWKLKEEKSPISNTQVQKQHVSQKPKWHCLWSRWLSDKPFSTLIRLQRVIQISGKLPHHHHHIHTLEQFSEQSPILHTPFEIKINSFFFFRCKQKLREVIPDVTKRHINISI